MWWWWLGHSRVALSLRMSVKMTMRVEEQEWAMKRVRTKLFDVASDLVGIIAVDAPPVLLCHQEIGDVLKAHGYTSPALDDSAVLYLVHSILSACFADSRGSPRFKRGIHRRILAISSSDRFLKPPAHEEIDTFVKTLMRE